MTIRIKWRLTATYLIAIFVTMTMLGIVLSYTIEHQFTYEVQTALEGHAELLRSQIEWNLHGGVKPGELDELCRVLSNKINARVTVWGEDNELLGCSESDFENPEYVYIPDAMRGLREGFGCKICHSEIRDIKTISVDIPLSRGDPPQALGLVNVSASLYEAQRASAKTRRIILVTLVITSTIVGIMAFRLASSIAEPVSHMNVMARTMASGDLSRRVEAGRMDEIGQLAESLNVMADRLQTNMDQLSQERDKIATVLASLADGIIVTDKSGVISVFNRSSERLFGLNSAHVIGKQVDVLDSIPDVREVIRKTLSDGSPIRRELATHFPADRIINLYSAPVQDQKGEVSAGVVVLQDVTEIRRQSQIRKDFVANVSHELRTPVASIRAITGALETGAMDDPEIGQKFLENLEAETERLSTLLNDLLHISEIESGKARSKRTEVSLLEVTKLVVSELSKIADEYGVSVSIEIPPSVRVNADKQQTIQVLRNLIDNAIKYTESGGAVTVTGRETDMETVLAVTDTGVGIPPADLDRIFERFYRVDKARSRQMGGTGLGLSIVKDIVEAHGGTVMVESTIKKGSTFTVSLPKHRDEDS